MLETSAGRWKEELTGLKLLAACVYHLTLTSTPSYLFNEILFFWWKLCCCILPCPWIELLMVRWFKGCNQVLLCFFFFGRPDLIDMNTVAVQSNLANLEHAFFVAEKLGVARLLDPEGKIATKSFVAKTLSV